MNLWGLSESVLREMIMLLSNEVPAKSICKSEVESFNGDGGGIESFGGLWLSIGEIGLKQCSV